MTITRALPVLVPNPVAGDQVPPPFVLVTSRSPAPLFTGWRVPAETGKFAENVCPVTEAIPVAESTAIDNASSKLRPPRKVEYDKLDPVGLSLVTKASDAPP